jgi:hypothetical protein
VTHSSVAVAVIRDDPPSVLVAADLDVLHRALAVRLLARVGEIPEERKRQLQDALLKEQWSDAVAMWIEHTGVAVDVYTEDVLTDADYPEALLSAQMQFSPLFSDI